MLLLLIVLILVFGLGGWGWRSGSYYGPGSVFGAVLLVLLVLYLMGGLHHLRL